MLNFLKKLFSFLFKKEEKEVEAPKDPVVIMTTQPQPKMSAEVSLPPIPELVVPVEIPKVETTNQPKQELQTAVRLKVEAFRFEFPDTLFKERYNWICKTLSPQFAIAYAVTGSLTNAIVWRHAIDTLFYGSPYAPDGNSWPGSVANRVINSYVPGGSEAGSPIRLSIGYGEDWFPPRISLLPDDSGFIVDETMKIYKWEK